jgi:hypothetical protein
LFIENNRDSNVLLLLDRFPLNFLSFPMTADPSTVGLYNAVITDVMQSVEAEWRRKGGDSQVFHQIEESWRHRAFKSLGLDTPEPISLRLKNARSAATALKSDPLLDFITGRTALNAESSSSESSMESPPEDDSDDTGGGKQRDSDGKELGSDLDDEEVKAMVSPIVAADKLLCHFTDKKSTKRSKTRRAAESIEVTCAHFVLKGVPRTVRSGTLSITK